MTTTLEVAEDMTEASITASVSTSDGDAVASPDAPFWVSLVDAAQTSDEEEAEGEPICSTARDDGVDCIATTVHALHKGDRLMVHFSISPDDLDLAALAQDAATEGVLVQATAVNLAAAAMAGKT